MKRMISNLTFCNLNTAGVDTIMICLMTAVNIITFNLINTARNNGDYATCMSLDATIYNNVNISNATEQISGVHFVIQGHIKTKTKKKVK